MRMVIVDDEQSIVTALEREIRIGCPDGDFEVMPFTDPKRALEYMRESGNDVFLMVSDMRMPEMDGAELLKSVRATNEDVQTILLSGYSDVEDLRRAISTSIMGFMMKPWNPDELFSEIGRARDIWTLRREHATMKAEIDMQLEAAGEFQRLFLASSSKSFGSAKVEVSRVPLESMKCGGDYFDVVELPGGAFTLVLGDASGHGLKPAFVTVMLKTLIQGLRLRDAPELSNPPELLSRLNRELCRLLGDTPGMFTTLSALHFDPASGKASFSNGGQPPMFRLSSGEVRIELLEGGVLGVNPKAAFARLEFAPERGERIVMMTDGAFEDVRNQHKPDWTDLGRRLKAGVSLDAEALQGRFMELLPGGRFSDDSTIAVIDFGTGPNA